MKTNTYTFTNRAMAIVIAVMLMVMTFVSAIPVSAASRLDTTETVSFTANCDKSGYTFTVYKVANLVSNSKNTANKKPLHEGVRELLRFFAGENCCQVILSAFKTEVINKYAQVFVREIF